MIKGYIWALLEFTADRIITLIIFAWFAGVLGPEMFGIVAIAASMILLLQPLFLQGISSALVLRQKISDRDVNSAFWANLLASLLVVAMIFVGAPTIADAYGEPELLPLLRIMSLMLIFSAVTAIPVALMNRQLKFKWLAIRTVIGVISGGIVCFILLKNGFGAMSLAGYYVARTGIVAVISFVGSRYVPRFQFSLKSLRKIAKLSSDSAISSFFQQSTMTAAVVLVGLMFDPRTAGLFRMAEMITSTARTALFLPLGRVALAAFGRIGDDLRRSHDMYLKINALLALVIFPVIGGIIIVAPDVISIAFDEAWRDAIVIIQLLALSLVIYAFSAVSRPALFSIGQSRASLYRTAVEWLSVQVTVVVFSPLGMVAVMVALAGRAIIFAAYPLYLVKRYLSVAPTTMLRRWVVPLAATAIMIAVCLLFRDLVVGELSDVTLLAGEIMLGAFTYVIGLRLLAPRIMGQTLDMVHPASKPWLARMPLIKWFFPVPNIRSAD